MINPKEITIDNDVHIASFGYYDGIQVAQERQLTQATSFKSVFEGKQFIVCCGDVMLKVKSTEYPQIPRRTI